MIENLKTADLSIQSIIEYFEEEKKRIDGFIKELKAFKDGRRYKRESKYPHDFFDDDKFPIKASSKKEMHNICAAARSRGIKNVGESTYTNGTFEVVRTHYERK